MTTFQQALHIFRKDARHLRLEIGGILLLLFFLIVSGVQSWEGLQELGRPASDDNPLIVLLPVAWCMLIARAIQTEALPGDRHFWLTRPYSRMSLVLSKALLVLVFIILPFMLSQALIVAMDGLPLFSNLGGLLWNQVLLTVLLLLPIAAIAALTRNLAQFLPAAILVGGLLALPIGEHRTLGDLEWVRSSVGLMIATAIAAGVLWRQYRLRRSANTALLALGATVAGIILYLGFPQSAAFAIQSRMIGSPDGQFALRLGEPAPRKAETVTPNKYRQLVAFPLAVSGADPRDLEVQTLNFTFRTLSGITRHSSARVDRVEQKLIHTTSLDRTFFDAAKNSPVTVRGEFNLTQYGNARSVDVPLDGTPVYIPGPGQCGVVASYDERSFVCRSAFHSPKPFLSEQVTHVEGYGPSWDSYSPFPAQLTIYPVDARRYRLIGEGPDALAPAAPQRPATLVVREPVAYFRYTMDAPHVRLGNFAISEPKDKDDQ